MALNSKEAIEILESVVGRVGNDEEIESVTADLINLKDYLLTVDGTIDELNEELAKVNISIHAPAKGATGIIKINSSPSNISIHAPAKGATRKTLI